MSDRDQVGFWFRDENARVAIDSGGGGGVSGFLPKGSNLILISTKKDEFFFQDMIRGRGGDGSGACGTWGLGRYNQRV